MVRDNYSVMFSTMILTKPLFKGVTDDGTVIVFIESLRLRKFRSIEEAAERDKLFPLKRKDGQYEITNLDVRRKVSAALEISQATTCIVIFNNTDNIEDKQYISLNRDNGNEVNWEKVDRFLNLFVKYLVIKYIYIH